ncbi:sensor domain-containing protein [Mycolicibacterium boenickei]
MAHESPAPAAGQPRAPTDRTATESLRRGWSPRLEATRFFNGKFTAWRACNYTEISTSGGGQHRTVKTGVATEHEGIANVLIWPGDKPAGSAGSCEHAMSPRKNVIVDVRVCVAEGSMTSGQRLVKDIGKKITGER